MSTKRKPSEVRNGGVVWELKIKIQKIGFTAVTCAHSHNGLKCLSNNE